MSLPRYPDYKNSGVEWLGEVPVHWKIKRLKFVASVQTGVAKGKDNAGKAIIEVPYLRVANVQDGYLALEDIARIEIPADDLARYRLQSGDVLMNEGGDFDKLGRGHIWKGEITDCIHQNHVFAVRPTAVCSEWLNKVSSSYYAQFYFMTRSKQSTNLASISSTNIMELPLVLPPDDEQQSILHFLNRETGKIDALIAEQEKLLYLLAEKRQSTISHAVTRGLNPDVPMKDSGVEWLGEVPAHWIVSRIKYMVEAGDGIQMGPFGGMLLDLSTHDTGFKVYGQENTISGDFTRGNRWISEVRFKELERYCLRDGDLVLTRKGSLGNARLISGLPQPGICDSDTIRVRVNRNVILPELFAMLLHEADYVSYQIAVSKRGAILSGVNTETIANLNLVCPPLKEQEALLGWIAKQLADFESCTREATHAIELLKERRSALISAAVTGQVDVRGVVRPEQEAVTV